MELLNYPKIDYLLDANLESLHKESAAWLKTLHFWEDEMSFFYKLLHHHKFSEAIPSAEVAEIDKALVTLNAERLDRIRDDLTRHERQLAAIFKSASLDEGQVYRQAHRRLFLEIHKLNEDIRTFKQKIFSLMSEGVKQG